MAEKLEELQLPKAQVEIESRGAIYAVPFFKDVADAELEKPSLSPEDTRHPPVDASSSSARGHHPSSAAPFPTAPAVPKAGVPHSCAAQPGSPSPADQDGATGKGGRCAEARQEPSRTGRSSSAQGWGTESSSRDAGTELSRLHLTEGAPMAWVPVSWCGDAWRGAVGLSLPCSCLSVCPLARTAGCSGQGQSQTMLYWCQEVAKGQAQACCGTGERNGQAGAWGLFRGGSITRTWGCFCLLRHHCADVSPSALLIAGSAGARFLAGSWYGCLTDFPCPLQRMEQRWSGPWALCWVRTSGTQQQRVWAEGKSLDSP